MLYSPIQKVPSTLTCRRCLMHRYLTLLFTLVCVSAFAQEEAISIKKLLTATPWKPDPLHLNQWTAYVGNGDSRALVRLSIHTRSGAIFTMTRPCSRTNVTERLVWMGGDSTGVRTACNGNKSPSIMPPILEEVLHPLPDSKGLF